LKENKKTKTFYVRKNEVDKIKEGCQEHKTIKAENIINMVTPFQKINCINKINYRRLKKLSIFFRKFLIKKEKQKK